MGILCIVDLFCSYYNENEGWARSGRALELITQEAISLGVRPIAAEATEIVVEGKK